jgi:hypothetical protein
MSIFDRERSKHKNVFAHDIPPIRKSTTQTLADLLELIAVGAFLIGLAMVCLWLDGRS